MDDQDRLRWLQANAQSDAMSLGSSAEFFSFLESGQHALLKSASIEQPPI